MTGAAAVWVILVAAGDGARLGRDRPKAFVGLGSRTILAECLERLEQSEWIDAIIVVAPPGWEEPAIALTEELVCSKVVAVVPGGATRADSVRAGLAETGGDAVVIVVHDVARPLVDDVVIGRVLTGLERGVEGVVPGLPIADTVKRVDRERVIETLSREELVAIQTPQAFRADALRIAYAGEVAGAGDCASLVEATRGQVLVVAGDRRLHKITDGDDLALVESWLV